MCLYTQNPELLIAKEDITCYKILRKDRSQYKSPVFNKYWKLHCSEQTKLGTPKFPGFSSWYEIEEGFHTFQNEHCARHMIHTLEANTPVYFCVAECTIPKRSKYYVGLYNTFPCFVSDNLIINKILEDGFMRHVKNL